MTTINNLHEIMQRLRRECPWDREQSFATIAPYTVEEAYEVADAIAREDWPGLCDELGDLLFQVVFHSRLAEEAQLFTLQQVIEGINAKLVRRHPHVFGSDAERARGPRAGSWERIKAAERGAADSALAGVAAALPALRRAQKLGVRAARAGFDWPDAAGPLAKIDEELAELGAAGNASERRHELGDLLFAVVNLARHLQVDAEQALTEANRRFERRFRLVEDTLTADGRTLSDFDLEALEQAWQSAKARLAE